MLLNVLFVFFLILHHLPVCRTNASRANSDRTILCGSKGFYCRANSKCIPRLFRCPSRNDKLRHQALSHCSKQDHCQPVYSAAAMSALIKNRRKMNIQKFNVLGDRFFVSTAFSPIYRTGSRSRRGIVGDAWKTLINDPWMHSFVQYRGFVYEFGSYGIQALDINDPNYKYNREWSTGWTRVATSICKYRHLRGFLKEWKMKRGQYSWYSNNCHSFTKTLVKYLKDDCRNLTRILLG